MLYYASATFCDEDTITYWQCGSACTHTQGVGAITVVSDFLDGTYGYVAYNNRTNDIVVAFRGSYDYANWYEDGEYKLTPYKTGPEGAEVHYGFYTDYQDLSSQVISAVDRYLTEHPTAIISVTGHSLGAALATFAALDIKEQIKPANSFYFYTFGSPRCGNQAFTDYMFNRFPANSYSRVVHYSDIVPHLPLTAMGFNHAGLEVWYNDNSNVLSYVTCPQIRGQPESEACSDSLYVYDPSEHLDYIGIDVIGQCTTPASIELDWY
ncbi:hypothetical protein FGO68_gene10993 [Halteria grandinella]|uniref:Fungal lipase-type domain-containing protein n=1 Tax=Halteria grandinella TaxID=5974 RepID=A0A8J8NKM7_HALGN|nr:hypothetical protein FGO68_gene10993 [Halteria grandinella]